MHDPTLFCRIPASAATFLLAPESAVSSSSLDSSVTGECSKVYS